MIEQPLGTLDILNVNKGDMKLNFNTDNEEEVEKAKQIIEDMLKRGYTILVEWGDKLRRVKKFLPKRNCYVIQLPAEGGKKKREKKIPTRKTRGTAIAPTGGG